MAGLTSARDGIMHLRIKDTSLMDLKILIASFALVFLAELGDKTQLAAMALTASTKSGWMVFIGTSMALITTTALAVVFGAVLSRWLPPNLLHIGSAIAFILVGVILLVNIAVKSTAPAEGEEAPAEPAATDYHARDSTGIGEKVLFSLIARQAGVFEEKVIAFLEGIMQKIEQPQAQQVLRQIIAEDRKHIESLDSLDSWADEAVSVEEIGVKLEEEAIFNEHLKVEEIFGQNLEPHTIKGLIEEAVLAEERLAHFYLALARQTRIRAAKEAFRWLAMEDLRHAQHLGNIALD